MGTYDVKIIADSIHADSRLTTFQLEYPRYIHAEVMTHRVFSRNASSSRAIPVAKLAQSPRVYPVRWGMNQVGMQASPQNLSDENVILAKQIWDNTADACLTAAKELAALGLHKQWANRMLEWFSTISVVLTSTEWDNFYELREHPDAQPEIQYLASLMKKAHNESTPVSLLTNEWHLPYVQQGKDCVSSIEDAIKCSVARCARTSYKNHDGTDPSVPKDIELYEKLIVQRPAHASPAEHQATPGVPNKWYGNFRGWIQHRKQLGL